MSRYHRVARLQVTSSPGSTSITGATSGCQRLSSVCGASRSRFVADSYAVLIEPFLIFLLNYRSARQVGKGELGSQLGKELALKTSF
jgi:hypothetical protein